jgi:protein-tyrosine-phosphatase
MRTALEKKGYALPEHRAKVFQREFFKEFDYIFVATQEIYEFLLGHASKEEQKKLYLATHFSEKYKDKDIEDPYGKGEGSFDAVVEIIEEIAKETLVHVS